MSNRSVPSSVVLAIDPTPDALTKPLASPSEGVTPTTRRQLCQCGHVHSSFMLNGLIRLRSQCVSANCKCNEFVRAPAAPSEAVAGDMDYPAAARSIALNLAEFCDESLPYPTMIATAARRARVALDHADAVRESVSTPAVAGDALREAVDTVLAAVSEWRRSGGSYRRPGVDWIADTLHAALASRPAEGSR
jgi:hypothetical protein